MPKIITTACGDLTGDGVPETVYLTGVQRAGSVAWQQIQLEIQDGASGRLVQLPLAQDAGYAPQLFIGSMTGPGRNDLMVSIDSGGSGGITDYTIYAFEDEAYRQVFSTEEFYASAEYRVKFLDHYVVQAESLGNSMVYLIDLSGRDAAYLSDIYDADGRLRQPQEGFVDPVSLLVPADLNRDGVLELMVWQRISGLYHADALGDFITTLAWNGQQFATIGQTVGILGTAG